MEAAKSSPTQYAPRGATLSLCALMLLVLGCLLPFLNKPVHMDDPLFIWVAQQIHVRWWDFFGGSINWYGSPMHAYQVMLNPPLTSYYLAGAMQVLGSSDRALHVAMLVPALGATAGIYVLARRFTRCPALATAMTVLSPAFLISATTLMSDCFMLCLWVWAVVAWVAGVRERNQKLLCRGSLLVLAAALAKYFAACLVPLFVLDALLVWRRLRWGLAWLLLPVLGMLGYQAFTAHVYGSGLLGAAVAYSGVERARDVGWSRPRVLTGLSFVGGCLLTAVPAAMVGLVVGLRRLAPAWRWGVLGLSGILYAALLAVDVPAITRFTHQGSLPRAELVQLFFFSIAALPVLGLAVRSFGSPSEAGSWLLGCWIAGTFTFVVWFNWTVNARTVLPMAPAVAILATRTLSPRDRWPWVAAGLMAVVSLGAAFSDQAVARSARQAAERIEVRAGPDHPTVWFQGHWGFQYYMEQWGATPLDAAGTRCLRGQLMVVPGRNSNAVEVPPAAVRLLDHFAPPQWRWISVMASDVGAGFYSDVCGPLPFAFGGHEPDPYDVYRVTRSIQYTQAGRSAEAALPRVSR